MKATKFVLVFTFVAFATMIFAQAERPSQNEPAPNQRCVKISLEKALLERGLRIAMYQQIKPSILINNQRLYTARVLHNRTVYFIYGTYAAWKVFFRIALREDPLETAVPKIHKKLPGLTK